MPCQRQHAAAAMPAQPEVANEHNSLHRIDQLMRIGRMFRPVHPSHFKGRKAGVLQHGFQFAVGVKMQIPSSLMFFLPSHQRMLEANRS
jgi:hypothetical protein